MHTSTILHDKYATKIKNGPHIFAETIAEQVFCFGWIVNGSKCLLLFPWFSVSRVIKLPIAIFRNASLEKGFSAFFDCYFCITNIRRFSRKNKSKISYSVCKSAIKLVLHDSNLPVPQPPNEKKDTSSVDQCASTSSESEGDLIVFLFPT